MESIKFTAMGDVGVDIYTQTGKKYLGGMALNNAIYAARAGAISTVISAVGQDAAGATALSFLQKENVLIDKIKKIEGGKTQSIEVVLDENKVQDYQNWDLGVLSDFSPNIDDGIFLSTQDIAISFYLPEFAHFFDKFAGFKFNQTLKVGDFTDLSEHGGDVQFLKNYKGKFDWYVLSIDVNKRGERLKEFEKLVVDGGFSGLALLGVMGSTVIHAGKTYHEPARKVEVVDTTGAGDSYVATFFTKYLKTSLIESSMSMATDSAAKTIQSFGAV
ncbi:hypothetical protein COY14_01885 [Candidatus Roizmanbacteria bacterium CG_4_10_14_0_2_um_filter_36_9]|uniref:Carbohydrate kinase PfkB domain-containing protein n=2 Tax=Candidatus Roizmaniibacteriota TaxID=1752723 RepID=A0A2M7U4L1_9BACT|nr:MAG: hypothetical protein COY14_01885 [Candidatus Roizmanbacteria bacterium CG_4_10_14_0_2_um_filter_36_9]